MTMTPDNHASDIEHQGARSPKVMIVEDTALQLNNFAKELQGLGIDVVSCHSRDPEDDYSDDDNTYTFDHRFETLEEFENLLKEHKPDLVLTDYNLANLLDGYMVANMVKTQAPSTSVILHTSDLHSLELSYINKTIERSEETLKEPDRVLSKYDSAGRKAALRELLEARGFQLKEPSQAINR